jgi:hypothetical protein
MSIDARESMQGRLARTTQAIAITPCEWASRNLPLLEVGSRLPRKFETLLNVSRGTTCRTAATTLGVWQICISNTPKTSYCYAHIKAPKKSPSDAWVVMSYFPTPELHWPWSWTMRYQYWIIHLPHPLSHKLKIKVITSTVQGSRIFQVLFRVSLKQRSLNFIWKCPWKYKITIKKSKCLQGFLFKCKGTHEKHIKISIP